MLLTEVHLFLYMNSFYVVIVFLIHTSRYFP
uniref:Uncharacterized protein n=1 Tax=Anguilla anguilla TaxID=7936 RepID=A0A0E9V9K8_ANGAN